MSITHTFSCLIADDAAAAAAGEVLPSHWNAGHTATELVSAFNVADYGALGDGSNDDTAEIQAALDAANAAGGGMVWIPRGTYKISNSLIVYSNTHVRGAGRGATVLRGTAGAYAGRNINGASIYCTIAAVGADRASIRDLTVDHATNETEANCIGMLPDGTPTVCTSCVVQDCEALSFTDGQYLIWSYRAVDCKIVNNYCDGGTSAPDAGSGQEGIEVYGGSNVLVSGNTVANIDGNGIYVWGDTTAGTPEDVMVVNNWATNCNVGAYVFAPAVRVSVIGNVAKDCVAAGIKTSCANGKVSSDVRIQSNMIKTALLGIAVLTESGGLQEHFSINGNTIIDATEDAPEGAIQAVRLNNSTISNNIIKDCAGMGIYVETGADIMICANNLDTIDWHGIYIYDSDRVQVLGNLIKEANAGDTSSQSIRTNASDELMIDHNGLKWTYEQYPIYVVAGSRCSIGSGNQLLRGSYYNPTFRNDGTNKNRDTVTLTAAATTTTITNSLVNPSSQIRIRQTAGPLLPFLTNNVRHGAFDMVHAAAAGTEVYAYEIA